MMRVGAPPHTQCGPFLGPFLDDFEPHITYLAAYLGFLGSLSDLGRRNVQEVRTLSTFRERNGK